MKTVWKSAGIILRDKKMLRGEIQTGKYHAEHKWVHPTPEELSKYKSDASWVTLLEDYFSA